MVFSRAQARDDDCQFGFWLSVDRPSARNEDDFVMRDDWLFFMKAGS